MGRLAGFFKLPVSDDGELMLQQKRLYPSVFVDQTSAMLLGLVNVAVTGTISSAALAGVGQVNTINNVIVYFFNNYAMGGNVMVAQNVGAKNAQGVKKSASQSLVLGMIFSLVMTVIIFLGRVSLLYALYGAADADVMKYSIEYFTISVLATPMWFIYYQCVGVFRSAGDTRTPMKIGIVMNAINIVLSYLFVIVMDMGPAGAGYSMLVAVTAAALLGLIKIFSIDSRVCIKGEFSLKLERDIVGKTLSIGIPAGIENLMFNGGKVLLQVFLSTMGTTVISAYQVANSIISVTQLPIMSYSALVITLVGQAAGTGSREKTRETAAHMMRTGRKATFWSMILKAVLCYPLAFCFSRDLTVVNTAVMMCSIEIIFMPFWADSFMLPNCFRSTRDVKITLIVGSISMWVVRVFGAYVFGVMLDMHGNGIMLAMCLDWIARGAIFNNRFKGDRWLRKIGVQTNETNENTDKA
ncbi:MAG: MATE family efflux transporter [Clostridiaceae bacterium]|nr:MATE family efflux transporter [Clostridiaceae bacterium]